MSSRIPRFRVKSSFFRTCPAIHAATNQAARPQRAFCLPPRETAGRAASRRILDPCRILALCHGGAAAWRRRDGRPGENPHHYLFPQLTMGLALLLVYFRTRALTSGEEHYHRVALFWTKIFALSFAFGVVTGIPLEFQFGTNWAKFSTFAGGVIGQTLAMEGLFAFFLESSFLGILLFGEGRFSRRVQWVAVLMLFLGSWLSGYFILATNAWMQHPVAYSVAADGR